MININSTNYQINQVSSYNHKSNISQIYNQQQTINNNLTYQYLNYKVLYCTLYIINKYYTVPIVVYSKSTLILYKYYTVPVVTTKYYTVPSPMSINMNTSMYLLV